MRRDKFEGYIPEEAEKDTGETPVVVGNEGSGGTEPWERPKDAPRGIHPKQPEEKAEE